MAFMITEDCISCGACEPKCPNNSIFLGDEIYQIDSEKCTECVGFFDASQCVDVCPVACVVIFAIAEQTDKAVDHRELALK